MPYRVIWYEGKSTFTQLHQIRKQEVSVPPVPYKAYPATKLQVVTTQNAVTRAVRRPQED
jgi:hypothetical protein